MVKTQAASAGVTGFSPGVPGGLEEGSPLQSSSCLETPRDKPGGLQPLGPQRVGTRLSD